MILLRSILFALVTASVTTLYASVLVISALFSQNFAYDVARHWGRQMVRLARSICGIDYVVQGWEHVPQQPVVVMAKHQSAWETVALLSMLPRGAWIIKRELLLVPFVGWSLAALRSIAIDRKSGKAAVDQILEQGRERLASGRWVMVFPEGTRVAPGKKGRYGIGGSFLAAHTATPVLPVAHNAGECWRRNAFLKYPGRITLSFGPLIPTAGLTPVEVGKAVEDWIENEMAQLPPAAR